MPHTEFFVERVNSEVRQQMEGVLALVGRLSRQGLKSEAKACLSGIGDAAATVLQIISASQDLSVASTAGLSFCAEPVALHLVADDLQTRWSDRASRAGLTLLVSYDGDPRETAQIDRARLLQAFDGLIGVAIAGARSGAVEASLLARREGDNLRLEGRVRGGGTRSLEHHDLDLKEVEALFGLKAALSLALSRQVVESQGGALSIEANEGGGDTLAFDLLCLRAIGDACQGDDRAPHAHVAHILVVDDNATNRMVAETLCTMFDCTTEAVEDGLEAIEAARSGRFDLILMDIKMPQMDGLEATRHIRALPGKAGRVPIVALTANADPEDSIAYLAAGMNGVVEKPMKPEHLLKALQDNLDDEAPATQAA